MTAIADRRRAPAQAVRLAPPARHKVLVLAGRMIRDNRRAPLTWGGSLGAMTALIAALWPSISGSMEQLVRSYPEGLKAAFGIEQLDSVEKYIDAEMLSLIVPLALVFLAVRCVTAATVGAEERGALDTLLSLPVARWVLPAASFLATACVAVAVLAVVGVLTWVTGTVAGTGISATTLAAGLANVVPLTLAFAGLALVVAGVAHHARVVTGATMATVAAMYVVDLVGKLAPAAEPLRVISAFRYYGSAIQDGIALTHVLGLTFAGVALAALGAALFERRDVL